MGHCVIFDEPMLSLVPVWMRSVPLLVALAYGPLTYLLLRLLSWATLRPYKKAMAKDAELHWTERARLSLGPRAQCSVLLFSMPVCLGLFAQASVGEFALANTWITGWVAGLSSFIGAFLALGRLGRTLGFESSSVLSDLRSYLFLMQGILIVFSAIVGFGELGQAIARVEPMRLVTAGLLIPFSLTPFLFYVFSALGVVHRAPDLEARLESTFLAAQLHPRGVWIARTSVANALAYPMQQRIVVTEKLLKIMDHDELASVVGHELGHLLEGRKAWLRYGLVLHLAIASFSFPFVPQPYQNAYLLGAWVSFLIFALLMKRWSKGREQDADAVAAQVSDPAVYASALAKIYKSNLFPAVQRGGTHPSLYDRMEAAGVVPDFPRPLPPPRRVPVLLIGLMSLVLIAAYTWPKFWIQFSAPDPRKEVVVSRKARPLSELALNAHAKGNLSAAIELYARAEELDPDSPWYPRNLTAVLDEAGRCEEARAASERSYQKAGNDPEVEDYLTGAVRCDLAEQTP